MRKFKLNFAIDHKVRLVLKHKEYQRILYVSCKIGRLKENMSIGDDSKISGS